MSIQDVLQRIILALQAYLVRCIAELGLETEWGEAQRAAGISA